MLPTLRTTKVPRQHHAATRKPAEVSLTRGTSTGMDRHSPSHTPCPLTDKERRLMEGPRQHLNPSRTLQNPFAAALSSLKAVVWSRKGLERELLLSVYHALSPHDEDSPPPGEQDTICMTDGILDRASDEDFGYVLSILAVHPSLRSIDISRNPGLTDFHGGAILKLIRSNRSICLLRCPGSGMGQEMLEELAGACLRNERRDRRRARKERARRAKIAARTLADDIKSEALSMFKREVDERAELVQQEYAGHRKLMAIEHMAIVRVHGAVRARKQREDHFAERQVFVSSETERRVVILRQEKHAVHSVFIACESTWRKLEVAWEAQAFAVLIQEAKEGWLRARRVEDRRTKVRQAERAEVGRLETEARRSMLAQEAFFRNTLAGDEVEVRQAAMDLAHVRLEREKIEWMQARMEREKYEKEKNTLRERERAEELKRQTERVRERDRFQVRSTTVEQQIERAEQEELAQIQMLYKTHSQLATKLGLMHNAEADVARYCLQCQPTVELHGDPFCYVYADTSPQAWRHSHSFRLLQVVNGEEALGRLVEVAYAKRREALLSLLRARHDVIIDSAPEIYALAESQSITFPDLPPNNCPNPQRFVRNVSKIITCEITATIIGTSPIDFVTLKLAVAAGVPSHWTATEKGGKEVHLSSTLPDLDSDQAEAAINEGLGAIQFTSITADLRKTFQPFSTRVLLSIVCVHPAVLKKTLSKRGILQEDSHLLEGRNTVSTKLTIPIAVLPSIAHIPPLIPDSTFHLSHLYSEPFGAVLTTPPPVVSVVDGSLLLGDPLPDYSFNGYRLDVLIVEAKPFDCLFLMFQPGKLSRRPSTAPGGPVTTLFCGKQVQFSEGTPLESVTDFTAKASLENQPNPKMSVQIVDALGAAELQEICRSICYAAVGDAPPVGGKRKVELILTDRSGVISHCISAIDVIPVVPQQFLMLVSNRKRPFHNNIGEEPNPLSSLFISGLESRTVLFPGATFCRGSLRQPVEAEFLTKGKLTCELENPTSDDALRFVPEVCPKYAAKLENDGSIALPSGAVLRRTSPPSKQSLLTFTFDSSSNDSMFCPNGIDVDSILHVIRGFCFTPAKPSRAVPSGRRTVKLALSTPEVELSEAVEVFVTAPFISIESDLQRRPVNEAAPPCELGPFSTHPFPDRLPASFNGGHLNIKIIQGSGPEDHLLVRNRKRGTEGFRWVHVRKGVEPAEPPKSVRPSLEDLSAVRTRTASVLRPMGRKKSRVVKLNVGELETALIPGSTKLLSPLSDRRGARELINEQGVMSFIGIEGDPPFVRPANPRQEATFVSRCRGSIRDHVRQRTSVFGTLLQAYRSENTFDLFRNRDGVRIATMSMLPHEIQINFEEERPGVHPVLLEDVAEVMNNVQYRCEARSEMNGTTKFVRFSARPRDGPASQVVCVLDIVRQHCVPDFFVLNTLLTHRSGQYQLTSVGTFPLFPYARGFFDELSAKPVYFDGGCLTVSMIGTENDALHILTPDEQHKSHSVHEYWRQEQMFLIQRKEEVDPHVNELLSRFVPCDDVVEMQPNSATLMRSASRGRQRTEIGELSFNDFKTELRVEFARHDPPTTDGQVVNLVLHAIGFKPERIWGRRTFNFEVRRIELIPLPPSETPRLTPRTAARRRSATPVPQYQTKEEDSRLRTFVDVLPPLLSLPTPNLVVKMDASPVGTPTMYLSNASVTLEGPLRRGYLDVRIPLADDGAEEDCAVERECLSLQSDQIAQFGCDLFIHSEYIGKAVIVQPFHLKIDFDWASCATAEHLNILLQSLAYTYYAQPTVKVVRCIEVLISDGKKPPDPTLCRVLLSIEALRVPSPEEPVPLSPQLRGRGGGRKPGASPPSTKGTSTKK